MEESENTKCWTGDSGHRNSIPGEKFRQHEEHDYPSKAPLIAAEVTVYLWDLGDLRTLWDLWDLWAPWNLWDLWGLWDL